MRACWSTWATSIVNGTTTGERRSSSSARWLSPSGWKDPESYHVSIDFQNLGIVARERKDYAKAVEYDTRALSIREKIVGADHPDIAPLLNNLANVQRSTGHDAEALATYFRALRIWETTRGPYFPATLNVVGNIARTYAGMPATSCIAIVFQRRADAIVETQLALNLAVGSERQKLAFVNRASRTARDRTISLSLNGGGRCSRTPPRSRPSSCCSGKGACWTP